MAEYSRPKTAAQFEENFSQKKPLMNSTEAYYESSRCLYCYDAPCMDACPTGIDIPLFIKQIHTDNITGAAKTIFDSNWLGNACGKICPTKVLCEGACVYNHQDVPPIQIGRLQNYATDKVIAKAISLYKPGVDNGKKVAMIGAGPASIACACELRTMGYNVDLYEAKSKPSGLTVYGIAPYKITNQEVLDEVEYLQNQLGFNIKYNHPITENEQISSLEKNYDAIFIGVGLGPTASLGLDGENLKGVIGAVEFVEELRMNQERVTVPDRVVVIGGGNTAMDAASESARMGASDVTLVYRRNKAAMGAYDFEYKLAVSAGVRGVFSAQPKEILSNNGNAIGVRFVKTELVEGKIQFIENSEFDVDADLVILATGQAKLLSLFDKISNLEIERKKIKVNDAYQTSNPIYFAGGDAVNGGAEVVNAAYEGKMAALGIDQMITKKQIN